MAEHGLVETSRLWPKLARPILLGRLRVELENSLPCKPKRRRPAAPIIRIHLSTSILDCIAPPAKHQQRSSYLWGLAGCGLLQVIFCGSPSPVLFCPAPVQPWLSLWACMHASIVPCMHPAHARRRYASMLWVAPWEIGSRLTWDACRPGCLSRPWCIAISPLTAPMHWPPAAGLLRFGQKVPTAVCKQIYCRHFSANRLPPRCCSVHLVFCLSASCTLP